MRYRGHVVGALLALVALVAVDAYGQYTVVGQGIQRVLINGARQPSGVSEIQCVHDGGACYRDAGVVTIDLNQVSGGGGAAALDAGSVGTSLLASGAVTTAKLDDASVTTEKIANSTILLEDLAAATRAGFVQPPDGGVASRSVMVSADDAGTVLASTAVAIDVSGNITIPTGATIDGRDPSADGLVIDSLPASSLSASFVAPGDAGFVEGVYRGTGATYNGDAGYVIPACRVSLPLRTACQVRVRWFAASVAGVDASSETVTVGSFCRIYTVRLTSTGVTPVDAGLPAYVTNCETDNGGLTAGIHLQADSGVIEPTVQGVAATHIRWMCRVDNIDCVDNP